MGNVYPLIDAGIAAFLEAQRLFFVATAPLDAKGHVNVSPKGLKTFVILDPTTVAYLDLTGSGIETVAHVKENGRIVLLFCSFDERPKNMRLHGVGEVLEPGHPDFAAIRGRFAPGPGVRSIIRVKVTRIANSCGLGVPRMDYVGERDVMVGWYVDQGEERLEAYRQRANRQSIDGLPGVRPPPAGGG